MRWSSSRLRLSRGTLKNVTSWLLYLTMNYRVFLLWLHFGSIHTIVTYCSYSTKKWKMRGTDWSYSYHLRIHLYVICFSHGLLFGRTILYLSFLWSLHLSNTAAVCSGTLYAHGIQKKLKHQWNEQVLISKYVILLLVLPDLNYQ